MTGPSHPCRRRVLGSAAVVVLALLAACGGSDGVPPSNPSPGSDEPDRPLRDVAPDGVVIGTAAAGGGHVGAGDDPFQVDEAYRERLGSEFSSVTPENQLKWEYVHPEPGTYDFAAADDIVAFAEEHDMVVRGHTLLWHSQNPAWLEEGDYAPDELRAILRDHVTTVVGRYAGRIQQWDVANEIIDDAGRLRTQENIWLRELGPGVIDDVFRWAHEADPDAQLFLNDFGAEGVNPKTDAYLALVTDLLARGVPVDGFGAQAHLSLEHGSPGDGLRENLQRFADLGLATAVTELDVRVPLDDGRASAEDLERQAEYYTDVVAGCLAVAGCSSITVWGFTDAYSWVATFFPGMGAATLLTQDHARKPAYDAVADALEG